MFQCADHPKNWNMKKVATQGTNTFWEVGYHHRKHELALMGFSDTYFFPSTTPPSKYWWCRDGDWLPYWGEETKKRMQLVKELRTYWMNKWFEKIIPEIKIAILTNTNLPEDIVEILPQYFEYPYEKKCL